MESRRGPGIVGGLQYMSLLLYSCRCTANGHITCEAAADVHVSNLGQMHAGAFAHVRGAAIMDGCPSPPLPLYRQQTKRGSLLWMQPCVTTDLYIGACGRQPVAMAPRVADAKGRMEGWLVQRGSCRNLSVGSYLKRQIWLDRAVGWLDHGGFTGSSNVTPRRVLAHICRVLAKLPLLPKDRASHQIFNTPHGQKHSRLPSWLL